LKPEDLERKGTSPQGVPVTAWKLLRAMIEHEVHHRGQLYMMLSVLDVPTPPLFGLTSEELRAIPPTSRSRSTPTTSPT
jgi:uncharacterized damage-inducible protein DinB